MEGDFAEIVFLPTPGNFYPRPHMEGDHLDFSEIRVALHFYPRPHMEGDPPVPSPFGSPPYFYPRPHMEGDHSVPVIPAPRFNFYPRPHMEGDSKHAEVQACISAAYLKCSTRKAAASRRCADLGGRAVLFHQLSRLVLGRARCEPRGEGMCDRGSHRQSGRRKGLKTHSSKMSSWLH